MRYGSETDEQLVTVLKSTSHILREGQGQSQSQSQRQVQKRPQPSEYASSPLEAVGYGRPSESKTSILSPLTIEPPKESAEARKTLTHI